MFNYLGQQPLRKPVAFIWILNVMIIQTVSFFTGRDIPSNTLALMLPSTLAIVSWAFGTSSYEHKIDKQAEQAEQERKCNALKDNKPKREKQ